MEVATGLEPVAFLIGTWRGRGRGEYPTIEPFEYEEEVRFSHAGKPFLIYHQRTWDVAGDPLHTEMGYVRIVDAVTAELVVAQPTGITEIHHGDVDGTSIRFVARDVGVSPTAKDVRAVERVLRVHDDVLSYRLDMEAVNQPMTFHLEADLRRTRD